MLGKKERGGKSIEHFKNDFLFPPILSTGMLSVEKGAFQGKMATTQKLDASTGKDDPRVLVDHKLNTEHISSRMYFLSIKALNWKFSKSSISCALSSGRKTDPGYF